MAVDLFDDERYDEHDRGPHALERRHEGRGRGRPVEVGDPRTHREGVDHADRALVGVRQGQHREKYVVGNDGKDGGAQPYLCAERAVGEHHPFGSRRGARSVDDGRQVVGCRHPRGALGAHVLRDDAEVLRAHDHAERLDGAFRELREELVRHEQRLGFGVGDDLVELLAREVGKNGHGDHACRGDREVRHAPVGHVAAQQRHLVARAEARTGQNILYDPDPSAHFGVGHLLAVVHGEGDLTCEALHTVADQFVKRVDRHNVPSLDPCRARGCRAGKVSDKNTNYPSEIRYFCTKIFL